MDWTQEQINSVINKTKNEVCAALTMLHSKVPVDHVKTIEHAVSLIEHLFKHSEYSAYYTEIKENK